MTKSLTKEMIMVKAKNYNLESIRQLNFWGCSLYDISAISQCISLESASFSKNFITTLKPFKNLINLKELSLKDNKIRDMNEVYYLKDCKNLNILWLQDNPICFIQGYRFDIIKILPNLLKLDDILISDEERKLAFTGGFGRPDSGGGYMIEYDNKNNYNINNKYINNKINNNLYYNELDIPSHKQNQIHKHNSNFNIQNKNEQKDIYKYYNFKYNDNNNGYNGNISPSYQNYYYKQGNNNIRNIPNSAQGHKRYEYFDNNARNSNQEQIMDCINVLLPGLSYDELDYIKDYIDKKISKY